MSKFRFSILPSISVVTPRAIACAILTFFGAGILHLHGQDGPFPPDAWPASADGEKRVHFATVDFSLDPLGAGWEETLTILSGGDQQTEPVTIGGFEGVRATCFYDDVNLLLAESTALSLATSGSTSFGRPIQSMHTPHTGNYRRQAQSSNVRREG